jgi:hypothetical protein
MGDVQNAALPAAPPGSDVPTITSTSNAPLTPAPLVEEPSTSVSENPPLPVPIDLTSTYANRNPLKEIIPPRQNSSANKTDAQKRAQQLQRDQNRTKLSQLKQDVNELRLGHDEVIRNLAKKHGRKVEYVEKLAKGL